MGFQISLDAAEGVVVVRATGDVSFEDVSTAVARIDPDHKRLDAAMAWLLATPLPGAGLSPGPGLAGGT